MSKRCPNPPGRASYLSNRLDRLFVVARVHEFEKTLPKRKKKPKPRRFFGKAIQWKFRNVNPPNVQRFVGYCRWPPKRPRHATVCVWPCGHPVREVLRVVRFAYHKFFVFRCEQCGAEFSKAVSIIGQDYKPWPVRSVWSRNALGRIDAYDMPKGRNNRNVNRCGEVKGSEGQIVARRSDRAPAAASQRWSGRRASHQRGVSAGENRRSPVPIDLKRPIMPQFSAGNVRCSLCRRVVKGFWDRWTFYPKVALYPYKHNGPIGECDGRHRLAHKTADTKPHPIGASEVLYKLEG